MNGHLLAALISLIFSLSICFVVYFKAPKNITRNVYVVFLLVLSFWIFTSCVMWSINNKALAVLLTKINYIFAAFFPALYVHLFYTITESKLKKFMLFLSYTLALIFLSISQTKLFISDLAPYKGLYFVPIPGPAYIFYAICLYIVVGIACCDILIKALRAIGQEKTKLLYFTFGSMFGFLGYSALLALMYRLDFFWADIPHDLFIIGYIGIFAYAIVRHQLMDIEVIIKKTLVYSVLIAIITGAYFVIIYLLERAFSIAAGYQSVPLTIAIIAIFSILFTPLKNRIQWVVDRRFFKGTIDQIEKEKTLLETELERAERLKTVSTLAAGMAHEIKNPLTGIKTFAEYVDKKHNDPEFLGKFKSIVPKEIDKITNIINQLLDYSKTDRTSQKECDIHCILDYVLDLYSNEFIQKHIKLRKSYNSQSPKIICDENQLKQAFINIVLNSIEAMPVGGTITVETKDIDSTLEISIIDTGKGIPKDKLKHLFDPFYTTKDKGTGLGLFIVHQIIENNKGRIEIESELGKGTGVKISFRR
ncbi:MAG: hypothetical protein A2Z72_01580 [Omnitrophica bacterium RBG_13_46_9]|nr:MAG: hypothetical protein A2Z72_01580 [Omnitrophica bacterium RBG_13_46_9]